MKNYKLLFFAIFAFSFIYLVFIGIFFQFDLEDNSLWHYIGWSWTQSEDILLKQFADNKPFGIYFLYFFSSKLFGINFFPLIILSIIVKITTGCVIYLILRELDQNKILSLTGLIIFYLFSSWPALDSGSIIFTETIVNLFFTLACYSILKSKNENLLIYFSVLFIFFGFIFKQTIIFTLPAFLFIIYIKFKDNFSSKIFKIIFFALTIFIIYFFLLINFGIPFEKIIKQTFFPLNHSSDVVMKITSRINNFIFQWTGVYKIIGIILIILSLHFYKRKNKLEENFFLINLFLIFIGVHFTGITNGHQLSQILPVISLLIPIALSNIAKSLNLSDHKYYIGIIFFLIFLTPEISFTKIKKTLSEFEVDKTYREIEDIKIYLDTNYDKEIPIHQHFRNTRVTLTLERIVASRFINTTFLYEGYGDGSEIKKNIKKLENDLKNKKHLLIILDSYEKEPPYQYPNFLNDNLNLYNFVKKFDQFLIYEKK